MRREIAEGLRYVLGHRLWRPIAVSVAIANFFNTFAFSILLVYFVRELELSAQAIGAVLAVSNLGWLAGAVAASRVSGRLGVGPTLVGSAMLFGPGLVLVPAAPHSMPIPFIVAGLIIATFGGVVFIVTGLSFMQAVTPDHILGRLNATTPVHRLGRDPARRARRRGARDPDRPPGDPLGGNDRELAAASCPSSSRPFARSVAMEDAMRDYTEPAAVATADA